MTQRTPASGRISSANLRTWGLVVLLLLALCASVFYRANPMIRQAEAYAGRVATASGGTYVALRSLNAVLSSVQEVEVGGSFVVQGSVQPLKVLEPVDDTVERVASVVFAIMLIAGVCAVSMAPLGAVGMGLIAVALAVHLARAGFVASPDPRAGRAAVVVSRLGRYGALLAIGLPLAFLLAGLSEGLTAGLLAEHRAVIAEITAEVAAMDGEVLPEGADWTDWLGGVSGDVARYRDMATQIIGRTDEMIASFLAILGIYVFRMVLLPALFLAMLLGLARTTANR